MFVVALCSVQSRGGGGGERRKKEKKKKKKLKWVQKCNQKRKCMCSSELEQPFIAEKICTEELTTVLVLSNFQ